MTAHSITFARHPNKRDIVVECSCGFSATAHNNGNTRIGEDALRLGRIHVEGERIKEAEKNEGNSTVVREP